jgi:2-keto-3-deoxy-6-phosphogluconate aldolase
VPPQIIDCLLPAACDRSKEQQKRLQGIVENLRTLRTGDITSEAVATYHAAMCNTGYEGTLYAMATITNTDR